MSAPHFRRPVFRRAATAVIVGALALGLTACGSSGAGSSATPTTGGTLTMARDEDVTSLLGQETSSNADIWLLQQVYEGLTANNNTGTGVVPDLATKWTTSADGKAWTFTLRPGVTFSNGKPLTADDVVWSLNFARNPTATNQWSGLLTPIAGVKKISDSQVEVDVKQAWPALPEYLALYASAIYPANFDGKGAAYFRTHTIGSGPFTVSNWTKGQSITLTKNAHYWKKGTPRLDSVKFTLVAADNTRSLQLQGGQIDVDEFPSAASTASLKTTSGITVKAFPSTQMLYFELNNKVKGLDDPLVRRALAYAIDRKSIIKAVLSGYGTPANSFLSSSLPGHDANANGAVYDMALAKATLAKSKYPHGLPITIELASGDETDAQIAQVAQQSWDTLGFNVKIKQVDAAVRHTDRSDGSFDVLIGYATSDVVDPYEMLSFLVLNGGGINSGFNDPQVEAQAKIVQSASTTAARDAALATIQERVVDQAPIIPIAYQPSIYAYRDAVHGFASATLGTYTLPETYLSK